MDGSGPYFFSIISLSGWCIGGWRRGYFFQQSRVTSGWWIGGSGSYFKEKSSVCGLREVGGGWRWGVLYSHNFGWRVAGESVAAVSGAYSFQEDRVDGNGVYFHFKNYHTPTCCYSTNLLDGAWRVSVGIFFSAVMVSGQEADGA